MEVLSTQDIAPVNMHQTVKVWSFIPKFSAYEETNGTYLEAVEEFTLAPGVRAEPHYHDTHEFFYILKGSVILQIENEARVCRVGDFIRIPRKAVHTGKALENGVRALAFSISYQEPGGVGYHPAELAEVEPKNL